MHFTLSPGILPLASFLWHPYFHKASFMSNFAVWEETGLVQFHALGKDNHSYSQEHIGKIMGEYRLFPEQYRQVRDHLRGLLKKSGLSFTDRF